MNRNDGGEEKKTKEASPGDRALDLLRRWMACEVIRAELDSEAADILGLPRGNIVIDGNVTIPIEPLPPPSPPSPPPSPPKKIKVVVQKWEETERGWGCRPDGYSIHPDEAARKRYVAAHWESMKKEFGEEAPDEYDRPNGTPYEAEVDEVEIKDDGLRYYEHEISSYPGHGGRDGWVKG